MRRLCGKKPDWNRLSSTKAKTHRTTTSRQKIPRRIGVVEAMVRHFLAGLCEET
jgi:hypothetical protein